MKLWQQILLGMVAGGILGALLGDSAAMLQPIGDIFIRLIKMIIVPLIFFSIVSAITGMDDIKKAGRIGLKSFLIYLVTTCFAISLGLAVSSYTNLGGGVELPVSQEAIDNASDNATSFSFGETLVNMVPLNPVKSMAEGNVLQLIIFAILIGFAINAAGKKGKVVSDLIHSGAEVTYKLTNIIMKTAPIGVFGLMAWLVGTQDAGIVLSLLKVVVAVYVVCALQIFAVYGTMLKLFAKVNPVTFFKKIIQAQVVAYTTSSSSATLPVTMKVAEEQLGVSKETSCFTLPLGTTVNMDGTALYQGVCAIFVAQAMGVDLVFADYVTIILTATLASIGSAGVPGAGFIMLSVVLSSVGLPLEAVAVIAGVDRILDMARTTVNVTGDATVALIVDKSEGNFDQERFDTKTDEIEVATHA